MAAKIGYGGSFLLGLHVFEMLVQVVVDIRVVALCDTEDLLERWVSFQDMLQKLSCGGLSAFGQPIIRDEDIAVWSPDTFDEDRLGRHGNMTC